MPRLSKRAQEAEIWGGLLFAHKLVNEAVAADLERETGLPLVWYDVLLILSNSNDGKLRLQELEDAILQSQSGISRLVDRMESAGHVTREKASDDGRGVSARITPEGRHVFRRAAPIYVRAIHKYFLSHMNQEEKRVVQDVLTRVCQNLRGNDDC